MNNLKTFEQFSNEKIVNNMINEGILDFMSKDKVKSRDVRDLKAKQDDILNKYDLSDAAKDNIRSRISDAISKKTDINIPTMSQPTSTMDVDTKMNVEA